MIAAINSSGRITVKNTLLTISHRSFQVPGLSENRYPTPLHMPTPHAISMAGHSKMPCGISITERPAPDIPGAFAIIQPKIRPFKTAIINGTMPNNTTTHMAA